MGLRLMKTVINSFNPYRLIACYAIFFVVRAEGNLKHPVAGAGVEGPIDEILESIITAGAAGEEKELVSDFRCEDGTCEGVLHYENGNDVSSSNSQLAAEIPLPSVVQEHMVTKQDVGTIQQSFGAPSPTLEKIGLSGKISEKPFRDVFTALPVLAPTSSNITNEICRKHSRIFVHQLKRYKFWALQMYDSSAKLPSGILSGNVHQFGDFDQCLGVDNEEETPHIKGKYCLASIDVEAMTFHEEDTETLHKAAYAAKSYEFLKSTFKDPGHFAPRFTTFNWGVCVPASCSAEDVQQALKDALEEYNETVGLSFDVNVNSDMCYTRVDSENPYSVATWCTIIFFTSVICIAVLATLMDWCSDINSEEQGKLTRMIMAFSIPRNIEELTADLPDDGDINCIYGVRAIGTAALYFAHKVIMLCLSPYSNRLLLTEIGTERWSIIFRASAMYTDSFLLISGVLTSFNLSKEIERKKHIDWLNKYMARFIRLTPALLALVLFYAYIMEHLGTGPLWNLSVKRNAEICKESFWKNILYIQTFFPFEQMCATHTHHLALDMQLSLLSPLLVTLLWQWHIFGVTVLLSLYTLSAVLRYMVTLQNQLSYVIYHGMTISKLYHTANLTYARSLHRATPYLLGVGLGYFMHKTGKNVHIPKIAAGVGWIIAVYFGYISLISPSHLSLKDYEYDVYEAATYAAFSPIIWSLALGWLIWACFTGHGGVINNFLCNKKLVMISRISYAVYLTQFVVFFYNVGSTRASETFSLPKNIDFAEVITVVIVSIVFTLLFDLPMQEIKNILMGSGKRGISVPEPTKQRHSSWDFKFKVI